MVQNSFASVRYTLESPASEAPQPERDRNSVAMKAADQRRTLGRSVLFERRKTMPTNFANNLLDLEQLRESIAEHLALVPGVERFLKPLDTVLTNIRTLSTVRNTLTADKQKVTQDLKASMAEAKNLAIDARAIIRGQVGSRSEKLVQFGIAPLRQRGRKSKPSVEGGGETKSAE
jgi:hypothetical protein